MNGGQPLDVIDRQILALLQEDARLPAAEIGRRVGLGASAANERIRRLEVDRVIRAYEARVDAAAVGLGVSAFVFVDAGPIGNEDRVREGLLTIDAVQDVYHVAGEDCFLVKVCAADNEALGRMLREDFGRIGARSTRTTIVLESIQERLAVPTGDPAPIHPRQG